MSNIVCKVCGITASTKCPNCRSIFYDNLSYAILRSNVLQITSDRGKITVSMMRMRSDLKESMTDEEMVIQLAKTLQELISPPGDGPLLGATLKQLMCDHTWAWQPGCSSEIGCGHKLN